MAERGPAVLPASDPASLRYAVLALQAGGIVGIPTETVYGIGVVPRPDALEAVVRAKQRPEDKGIALLIDDLEQVSGLVEVGTSARRLAERFWPGALTLVLPLRKPGLVPEILSGGRGALGVRLPDHVVPRALARELGPLAVTSANRSGEPPALTATGLVAAIGEALALVLDDGPVRGGIASTVVSVDARGGWSILRAGALDEALVAAALEGPEDRTRVH